MSSNAPQTQQPQDDPWTPKRVQGAFRHVYRVGKGKKRHWEFKGQQTGETVKLVLRKHKYFLITPAFPLIFSIIGLILVYFLSVSYPQAGPVWTLLEIVFGILILVTGVYFLYKDLALWWIETCIITNKRVMIWKGLLTPSRQETNLENVVQVGVDQKTLWSMLLSYGDVHLYLVGGKGAVLVKVPHPKKVRDLFQKASEEAKKSKPPPESHPEPQNPKLHDALEKLAKKEPLPTLPDPDEKYKHLHPEHKLRGPMRTFGGPLRLPCDVTYTSDEDTTMYVQRSKYVLVMYLILPVLLLLAAIIATISIPSIFTWTSILILGILVSMVIIYINYIDDVFIFTNKRIIDIERSFVFFFEEHLSVEYGQIKDVKVKVRNPLYLVLDIGDVFVETPGTNPDIKMTHVDHPFSLQDIVYRFKGHKEKVDKIKSENVRKDELNKWFGTVLLTMEQTVVNRGVPNLLKMDLFKAAERAKEFGMKVVPVGEDPSYPNIAPGNIVSQNPMPGTLVRVESDDPEQRPQIRVILSRRP
jgi:PH (Pleckstrin Homology) domain-containing protein